MLKSSGISWYVALSGVILALFILLGSLVSKVLVSRAHKEATEHVARLNEAGFYQSLSHSAVPPGKRLISQKFLPNTLGLRPEAVNSIILCSFVFMGFLLTVALVRRRYEKTAHEASAVLSRLKQGDFSARFALRDGSPSHFIALQFNSMAEEIQKLVLQMKAKGDLRKEIFDGIAHDIRTPVTSLQSLLESARDHRSTMSPEKLDDFLLTSIKECSYISQLIENILFVSHVESPEYNAKMEKVSVYDAIDECSSLFQWDKIKLKIDVDKNMTIFGDRVLIYRLFRNSISNAFTFAKTNVLIKTRDLKDGYEIIVNDDGPGFSDDELENFGEKRTFPRKVHQESQKISVGLGALIMSKIIKIHGGQIKAFNREKSAKTIGASLVLKWPPPKV